jgi:DNA (cytosine-5)-methyltransferase 1
MTLTYAELFAGAGGLSLGLEAAGFHAVAHAEIEPHARAVLRRHWPDTRLDGDVTKIDGRDYAGVTLLSGGSPCQDLSVAGKRAGLGGARSGLFYEQVRLWSESGAPYLLWENVGGALSSNNGRDFAAVLSALVGSPVPVPADGWRGGGGVVAGRTAVAAFRVLDLQHFGPPQRRVRVFVLAARTGGVDPAEVLALGEGVCGHPSPRQQAREGTAGGVGTGAQGGGVMAFQPGNLIKSATRRRS